MRCDYKAARFGFFILYIRLRLGGRRQQGSSVLLGMIGFIVPWEWTGMSGRAPRWTDSIFPSVCACHWVLWACPRLWEEAWQEINTKPISHAVQQVAANMPCATAPSQSFWLWPPESLHFTCILLFLPLYCILPWWHGLNARSVMCPSTFKECQPAVWQ